LSRKIIEQILAQKQAEPQLYNINIPTAALDGTPKVCVVPMNVTRYGDRFEKRHDPWGRDYYWLTGGPAPLIPGHETDLTVLAQGDVSLTPLDFNLTRQAVLAEMKQWQFQFPDRSSDCKRDES
jgi:5'-nucleotidase